MYLSRRLWGKENPPLYNMSTWLVETSPFSTDRVVKAKGTRWLRPAAMQGFVGVGFTNNPTLQDLHIFNSFSHFPTTSLPRPVTFQLHCSGHLESPAVSNSDAPDHANSETLGMYIGGLFGIAALIGSATILSKLLGLVRETVLAAIFGVGPVINAFSYSSIIPGFFLTILGGINGPFHTATAASLSKMPKDKRRHLVQKLTTVAGMICGAISIVIFGSAGSLVDAVAPGLMVGRYPDGLLIRKLAIIQLQIMAPCAMLAALIGIGFGTLNTAGIYGVPSLSPALSSITVIFSVGIYVLQSKKITKSSLDLIAAAVSLASGVTVGAMSQWGLQATAQHRAGFRPSKISGVLWSYLFEDEGVHEVFSVLLPSAVASGMLQIATYTDLYFASFIPGAAAGLGYANLLAMAPLGILSSSILIPLLPLFSRLSKPGLEQELQERVRQGLLLSMVLTLLMTTLTVALAGPIVRIVFERHAFDASASLLVSSLLLCYTLGSTCYLARDLLIRVFYALGDGHFPFQISIAAIGANIILDWLLVQYAGVQGLVMATSLVNCASAVVLLVKLSRKLEGLQLRHWTRPVLLLGFTAAMAGVFTKYSYGQLCLLLLCDGYVWAADILCVILASGVGVITYFIPILLFGLPEVKSVFRLLQVKM